MPVASRASPPKNLDAITRWDMHDLESSIRQLAQEVCGLHEEQVEIREAINTLADSVKELEKVIERLPENLNYKKGE